MEPEKILSLSQEAQFQVNIEGIKETQVCHKGENYTIRAKVVYQKPDSRLCQCHQTTGSFCGACPAVLFIVSPVKNSPNQGKDNQL